MLPPIELELKPEQQFQIQLFANNIGAFDRDLLEQQFLLLLTEKYLVQNQFRALVKQVQRGERDANRAK